MQSEGAAVPGVAAARGLARFLARFGPENVPVPLQPEGDSPIFADFAAKIGTVPVKGYNPGNNDTRRQTMTLRTRFLTVLLTSIFAASAAWAAELPAPTATRADGLEDAFQSPPPSARPWAYWFWINGNITKEGITADLESMARVGIKAVLIMECSCDIPEGPVKFLSPEWRELFKHTLAEADRLGLQVDMNNDAGWCGSGGPWNTPEHSMQRIVATQIRIEGGRLFEGVLPKPPVVKGFYRDIEVLAMPQPASASPTPKLTATSNYPNYAPALAQDGMSDTRWISNGDKPGMGPTPEKPEYLQFDYDEAWPAAGLYLLSFTDCGPKEIEVQCSEDGKSYRTIKKATLSPRQELWLGFDEVRSKCFRVVFLSAHPHQGKENWNVQVAEIELLGQEELAKREAPKRRLWDSSRAVDLTAKMDAEGRLAWDVPAGNWIVLRIGHTSTGKENHPSPASGQGLECDKLSREALEAHFEGMMGKLIADAGALAGKVLTFTHIDSWEVGSQNWTPKFREEFQRLRGYDPLPLLPAETGRIVDSAEINERFQWDVRQTVNDLLLENYAAHLQRLSQKHALRLSIEAYGGPCINLAYAGRADMPMGEFWVGGGAMQTCKEMASASHVYGKPITGAEAFTSTPDQAKWQHHPYSIKATGDAAFCEGINRFVLCFFTHQPWLDRAPGMTLGGWGFHYDRTETWWEQSKAWHDYLARCQYVLQSGLFAADICYLDVEDSPRHAPYRGQLQPPPPAGYEYDICPAEVLRTRMTVQDGLLVLPDGMSYRLLVLPPTEKMTPETLGKVCDLAKAGAVVVATTRPNRSPSLRNHPDCDQQVQAIARELFGDAESPAKTGLTERKCGAGRILLTRDLSAALAAVETEPDIEFAGVRQDIHLRWIHRHVGDAEFYFISNQRMRDEEIECDFRVSGRLPELWHPETGCIRDLPVFREDAGRTRVPLRLGPAESVFVVFRKPASGRPSTGGRNWTEFKPRQGIAGPWSVTFDPRVGGPADPVKFDKLEDWSKRPEPGIKYFSGTATYRKEFDLAAAALSSPKSQVFLDLGRVEVIATVTLNGQELGTLWKPPFRIDVTDRLKPGRNTLELRVANLWCNRLIGDQQLPEDAEWRPGGGMAGGGQYQLLKSWPQWLQEGKPSPSGRRTFSTARYHGKDDPLLPSGLLGPVTLEVRAREKTSWANMKKQGSAAPLLFHLPVWLSSRKSSRKKHAFLNMD